MSGKKHKVKITAKSGKQPRVTDEQKKNRISIILIATTFLSSFLLFFSEPLFAKILLPVFGGSASVWVTSLVFYQIVLLAGYAYARWLSMQPLKRQILIHLILMLVSLLWLSAKNSPALNGWPPALSVFILLAKSVGLPFLILSSHGPLLQSWASRWPDVRNPYRLSIPSNIACIAALLAFPFLLEPRFGLKYMHLSWSMAYVTCLFCVAACVIMAQRMHARSRRTDEPVVPEPDIAESSSQHRLWMALSFVPAALLTSVTLVLSLQVAPLPWFWTVPLALYLATLAAAFGGLPDRMIRVLVTGVPLAGILSAFMALCQSIPTWVQIAGHLTGFTWLALAMHAVLVSKRPSNARLTTFYLYMAVGSTAGGIFSGLVAPWLFKGLFEYPLLLLLAIFVMKRHRLPNHPWGLCWRIGTIIMAMVMSACLSHFLQLNAWSLRASSITSVALVSVIFLRPLQIIAAALGIPLLVLLRPLVPNDRVIYADRSFYGIHRVYVNKIGSAHWLANGTTIHGGQWLAPKFTRRPLAYYDASGPLGDVFRLLVPRRNVRRIAVIGLGAAGMTAYAHREENWTYFEIDPAVIRLANNPQLFTYLRDCPAPVQVIAGDARISLEQQPDHSFDMLILDAFGGDWIPMHLLTSEAIELYTRKLTQDGFIVFHVSNTFLDLWPVVASLAESRQYSIVRKQRVLNEKDVGTDVLGSRWVVISPNPDDARILRKEGKWHQAPAGPKARVWTDDLSSLSGLMVW